MQIAYATQLLGAGVDVVPSPAGSAIANAPTTLNVYAGFGFGVPVDESLVQFILFDWVGLLAGIVAVVVGTTARRRRRDRRQAPPGPGTAAT